MSECFDLILSKCGCQGTFLCDDESWQHLPLLWCLKSQSYKIRLNFTSIIRSQGSFSLNLGISSWLCKREIILKNCITSATFFSLNDISVKKSNLLHSTRWKCLSIFGCILHWNSENVSLFKNKVAKNGATSNQTWYHVPLYLFLRNWE